MRLLQVGERRLELRIGGTHLPERHERRGDLHRHIQIALRTSRAQIGQLGTQRRLDRLLRLGIVGQRAHLAEGLGRLEYEIGYLWGRGQGAVVSTCMQGGVHLGA